jgi:hypothetical protein
MFQRKRFIKSQGLEGKSVLQKCHDIACERKYMFMLKVWCDKMIWWNDEGRYPVVKWGCTLNTSMLGMRKKKVV